MASGCSSTGAPTGSVPIAQSQLDCGTERELSESARKCRGKFERLRFLFYKWTTTLVPHHSKRVTSLLESVDSPCHHCHKMFKVPQRTSVSSANVGDFGPSCTRHPCCQSSPVQFIVKVNTQVLVFCHHLYVKPWMFSGVSLWKLITVSSESICSVLVSADLLCPSTFSTTRYFLQSSPDFPGVVLLQLLLQFPDEAVFPYFLPELLLDSPQFLFVP